MLADELKNAQKLYEEELINQDEYDQLRTDILAKNDSVYIDKDVTNKKVGYWVYIVAGIGIILLMLVGLGLNVVREKQAFARSISYQTNYDVTYDVASNTFVYIAKDGSDWEDTLVENTEKYATDNQVYTAFINEWRDSVIPSFQSRSMEKSAGDSTLMIQNPENASRYLLKIKKGNITYDAFSDIERE